MTVTIKVEGLKELRHALLELPKELHKGPLRAAVSAGAKVVQDKAKSIVAANSTDTGALGKSIYRTRSRSNSNAHQEAQIVGARSGGRRADKKKGIGAKYWSFVEFGTSKMAAEPFLRPAFNSTVTQQIEAIKVKLAAAILKAEAKLRWK